MPCLSDNGRRSHESSMAVEDVALPRKFAGAESGPGIEAKEHTMIC